MSRSAARGGRQWPLALGCEQPLGREARLERLERALQATESGILEMLDQQLIVAARLVQTNSALSEHQLTLAQRELGLGVARAEHRTAQLRITVLQREIPVARGGTGEVGHLTLDPHAPDTRLEQSPHLAIQARHRINHPSRVARRGSRCGNRRHRRDRARLESFKGVALTCWRAGKRGLHHTRSYSGGGFTGLCTHSRAAGGAAVRLGRRPPSHRVPRGGH
jgi:hypothetical protein